MNDGPVKLLIQEIEDYLDAGSVGLYEFMWILNSEKVEGSKDDHRRLARQALDHLLLQKRGHLISLMWAQPDTQQDLNRDIRPEDFDDPQEDIPYVAITRD
jgi:hypothetical protein